MKGKPGKRADVAGYLYHSVRTLHRGQDNDTLFLGHRTKVKQWYQVVSRDEDVSAWSLLMLTIYITVNQS